MKFLFKAFYVLLFGNIRWAKKCGVTFGKNCSLLTTNWGTEPFLIKLGDNVTITSGVRLLTHDGSARLVLVNGRRHYIYDKIEIGSNVFIGINSIVMPGVKIGNNCVIGAGSVVTKDVPDNCVFAGAPAKFLRNFKEFEEKIIKHAYLDSGEHTNMPSDVRVNHIVNNIKNKNDR